MTAFDTVVLFDVENLLGAPTGWKKAAAKLSFRRHPDGDPQSVALVLKQVAVSGIQNEELSVVTDRVAAALSGTVGAADVKFTLLALAYNAVMSGQPPEAAVEERRYTLATEGNKPGTLRAAFLSTVREKLEIRLGTVDDDVLDGLVDSCD